MSLQCRVCFSTTDLRRTRPRGPLERFLLSPFGLRPLRCTRCGHRFVSRREPDKPPNSATTGASERERLGRPPGTSAAGDEESFEQLVSNLRAAEEKIFSSKTGKKRAS